MPDQSLIIALIPARAGSKRIRAKNIRMLGGHPLIAYTISTALESGVFSAVVVSTDSHEVAEIAQHYGAEVPFLRPEELAGDFSPDIEWVKHMLGRLERGGRHYNYFSILRPTSPFRTAETILRAWQQFLSQTDVHSLRAIEKCKQHPGKMWIVDGQRMHPLLSHGPKDPPWHSTPYQALPEIYVQNASLEIAHTHVVFEQGSISGEVYMPFFTQDYEGLDINDIKDWLYAEHLLGTGEAKLPYIAQASYRPR